MNINRKFGYLCLFSFIFSIVASIPAQDNILTGVGKFLTDIHVECYSDNILVSINASDFNGMIYPKSLPRNSSCLAEYDHISEKGIVYKLPLRACNTMSHETKEGQEYFNTLYIEPHHKLVTSEGKSFQVRCRYTNSENKNRAVENSLSVAKLPKLPNVSMKIYLGHLQDHVVAEHVKVGEFLTLVISTEKQDHYGLKVTNCIVRDGLGQSEQPLINNDGCPIDESIFGHPEYDSDLTRAHVTFHAHKFPITSAVYYQCNIKLCSKKYGGCDDSPPVCDEIGHNVRRRRKRQAIQRNQVRSQDSILENEAARERSVDVYSGLYVNEDLEEVEEENDLQSSLSTPNEDEFCVSTRRFAIGIAIGGVLLALAIILLVACVVHRRRRRKGTSTHSGSSIYSGPYSNQAYSRD